MKNIEQRKLDSYKGKLELERKRFQDYLGSCSRYLSNKRAKNLPYIG